MRFLTEEPPQKHQLEQLLCPHLSADTQADRQADRQADIFPVLADAPTAAANRPLREMTSQLAEVCPSSESSGCAAARLLSSSGRSETGQILEVIMEMHDGI